MIRTKKLHGGGAQVKLTFTLQAGAGPDGVSVRRLQPLERAGSAPPARDNPQRHRARRPRGRATPSAGWTGDQAWLHGSSLLRTVSWPTAEPTDPTPRPRQLSASSFGRILSHALAKGWETLSNNRSIFPQVKGTFSAAALISEPPRIESGVHAGSPPIMALTCGTTLMPAHDVGEMSAEGTTERVRR